MANLEITIGFIELGLRHKNVINLLETKIISPKKCDWCKLRMSYDNLWLQ